MVNTTSLYSVMTYGRGITKDSRFLDRMTGVLEEFLRDDGFAFIWERIISPETASIRFSKSLSRSVTGSMNNMIRAAKYLLINREMAPYEVAIDLNGMIMSMIEHRFPRVEFRMQQPD